MTIDHAEIAMVMRALFISTHPVEVRNGDFRESTVRLWCAVLNVAQPGVLEKPEVVWATLVAEANEFLTHYGGIAP